MPSYYTSDPFSIFCGQTGNTTNLTASGSSITNTRWYIQNNDRWEPLVYASDWERLYVSDWARQYSARFVNNDYIYVQSSDEFEITNINIEPVPELTEEIMEEVL